MPIDFVAVAKSAAVYFFGFLVGLMVFSLFYSVFMRKFTKILSSVLTIGILCAVFYFFAEYYNIEFSVQSAKGFGISALIGFCAYCVPVVFFAIAESIKTAWKGGKS